MSPFAVVRSPTGAAALLLLLTIPSRIEAQQPRRAVVGDRIRLETTTASARRSGPTSGTFLGATADTLYIGEPRYSGGGLHWDSVTAIDRRSVRRLEVSVGHRHARTGAIVGGIGGAVLGAGLSISWDLYCTYCSVSPRNAVVAAVLLGAPAAGAGALVGKLFRGPEPWVAAQIPAPLPAGDTAQAP